MKYALDDRAIIVDSQPVARIEILPGELNGTRIANMISAANRGTEQQYPNPVQAMTGLENDIDETGAGDFLAAHHVPMVSPDIGSELIRIVKRLEAVEQVYPLPPTVEIYRLALHLLLQVATEHQRAFCAKVEKVLGESD